MTGDERERRDSRALEPELITDPLEKAAAETRNGFRQYDAAIKRAGSGVIQASALPYPWTTARGTRGN